VTCSVVSNAQELQRRVPEWCDLLQRSTDNQLMCSPTWLLPWWRIYGWGRELRVGLFRERGRLVGLAPFQRRRFWHRRCLPFRRLEPLGADVDEGDGVGSQYLGVIAERGTEDRVAHALAIAVAAGGFGTCDEIVVSMMGGDGPMPGLLRAAFDRAGLAAECQQIDTAPYIPLPATWDAYLEGLAKKERYFVRRSLRDFESWASGDAQVQRVTCPSELAPGQRILTALHVERWSREGHSGAYRSPRFGAFHDAALPDLLSRGALQLWWRSVRGDPVAASYNLLWNGRVLVYQTGRKLDVPRGIRPGIVLHIHLIRAASEAGHREYDFLRGPAQYKSQLAPASRPLVQVRAARPSLLEHARSLLEAGIARTRPIRRVARNLVRRCRLR
jgi:CelD/BcsL family acetyltransferase involved in cellulose biosynthesis